MKVSDEELRRILDYRARRDHDAFMIGVATEEWMRHVEAIRARIRADEDRERLDGEHLLRDHGLDPQHGDYRIEPDGQILKLVNGHYVSVPDISGVVP